MHRSQVVCSVVLSLAGWACSSGHPLPSLVSGVAKAITALPWDADSNGWGSFCSRDARCDTLLIDPRVVRLPAQPPTFFVPAVRPLAMDLRGFSPSAVRVDGHPTRYADWGPCLSHRHESGWASRRVACVALGIAGDARAADTVNLALLVVTPSRGLLWPHLRLVADGRRWRVQRVWMGEE